MKLAARLAAPVTALALAGLTACAPQTSDNSSAKEDEKTGTLRVWLFQEVSNEPKQKVVDQVVAAFEKAHDGAKVKVEYIPVETRAQRIKAAFNDPESAPDVIEYGNTDTAGYVKDGGLADVTTEFNAWSDAGGLELGAGALTWRMTMVRARPVFESWRTIRDSTRTPCWPRWSRARDGCAGQPRARSSSWRTGSSS